MWAHAVVLGALLIALAPFMHLTRTAWNSDEGLYGLQVEALRHGSWEYEYAGEDFDSEHRWFPFLRVTQGEEGIYPYVKHPTYPALLAGTTRVTGDGAGVFAMPMFGLLVAAMVAWLLASEIEARAAPAAFWLVVVSPQIVNAYTLWAHTLSAAIAGLAVLAGVRVVRRGLTVWNGLGLGAALGVGVLFRTEAILFAGAFTVGLTGVLAWRRHLRAAVVAGMVGTVMTGVGVLLERWWIESIAGESPRVLGLRGETAGRSTLDFLEGRVGATWRVLFDGGNVETRLDSLVVVALGLSLIAGLALRLRGREGRFVGVTVAVGGAFGIALLYGARFAGAPEAPMHGFLATWPVALFGLTALGWKATTAIERAIFATSAVFGLAVFATQYDVGGGAEWGGRFLSPLVVPLAAVVAAGLVRRLSDWRWQQRATVIMAIVVLAAFPASRGVEAIQTLRGFADFGDDIQEVATDVIVVENPGLVTVPLALWRLDEDVDWFVSYGRPGELLSALAHAGVEEVTVLTDPTRDAFPIASYTKAENVTTPALKARGIPAIVVSGPVNVADAE